MTLIDLIAEHPYLTTIIIMYCACCIGDCIIAGLSRKNKDGD